MVIKKPSDFLFDNGSINLSHPFKEEHALIGSGVYNRRTVMGRLKILVRFGKLVRVVIRGVPWYLPLKKQEVQQHGSK